MSAAYTPTYLAPDWRISPVVHMRLGEMFELEVQDPARLQWHSMFSAMTEDECRAAYETYSEGEQPEGNSIWP